MEASLFSSDSVKVDITEGESTVDGFDMVSVVVRIDYADVSLIGDPFNLGVTEVRGTSAMLSEQ